MFKVGDRVKVKQHMSTSVMDTLKQFRIFDNKIYVVTQVDLQYNTYYGGANQLLKFSHTTTSLASEYFDLIPVKVGFVIE
jgi:hypothetical protein